MDVAALEFTRVEWLLVAVAGGLLICAGLLIVLLRRTRADVSPLLSQVAEGVVRNENVLREELSRSQTALQGEFSRSDQLIRRELSQTRQEQAAGTHQLRVELTGTLKSTGETVDKQLEEVRGVVDARLREMQGDNAKRLDEMRATVDEKLQGTLEERLGRAFRQVSERLEAVHQGLGEMQTLASGVGDLKRVLTNVKSRGTWGEVQLGALLEQMLAPGQYEANVATRKGSAERVEFAVRLPGPDDREPVWLPIDAKFPVEDYRRLLDAQEAGDAEGVETAARAVETQVRKEARRIRDKYLNPPRTTDFAILFLPTEGLYGEVLRRPGLLERLQQESRVTVAGPTTLAAMLSSLQMGFRTLAIQKRSSEVWKLLGTVKGQFGQFSQLLDKVSRKLDEASSTVSEASRKTKTIEKRLGKVEALPGPTPLPLFDLGPSEEAPERGDGTVTKGADGPD